MSNPKLCDLLFPQFSYFKTWTCVNIDEEARLEKSLSGSDLINHIQEKHDGKVLFGGYFEDRHYLLRDTYLLRDKKHALIRPAWHMGVDYWVDAGTKVHLPVDSTLLDTGFDGDADGGWGGKLIFELKSGDFLILGHLDPASLPSNEMVGKPFKAGQQIALVGPVESNGGWHPHLHLQVCDNSIDPIKADGYSMLRDGIDHDFPRPETILGEE